MKTELICHKGKIYSVPRLQAVIALLKFAKIEIPAGQDRWHKCPEITYRGQRLLNERFDLIPGGF